MYLESFSSPHKYNNKKLTKAIHQNLPMNEFAKGNFSNAFQIIDVFQGFLTKCLQEAKKTYSEGLETDQYLKDKLAKLQSEFQEKTQARNDLKSEIKTNKEKIKKHIENLKSKFGKEKPGSIFMDQLTKLKDNLDHFETFFDAQQANYPENFYKVERLYNEILLDEDFENARTLQHQNDLIGYDEQELHKQTSHGKNKSNLEIEINKIEKGITERYIKKRSKELIRKNFGTLDNMGNVTDPREPKEFFGEFVNTQIILHKQTDQKTRINLIKNLDNKIDFLEYLAHNLMRKGNQRENKINHFLIDQGMIKAPAKEINTEILKKYIFAAFDDAKQKIDKTGYRMSKITDKEMAVFKLHIKRPKTTDRNGFHDPLMKNAIEKIDDYFDQHFDFYKTTEAIWNYEFYNQNISINFLMNIIDNLIKYMNQEELQSAYRRFEKVDLLYSQTIFRKIMGEIQNRKHPEFEFKRNLTNM